MALEVFLSDTRKLDKFSVKTALEFEDNGYYWFLWNSCFKDLEHQTGYKIDLYADVVLSGKRIEVLKELISETKRHISDMPLSWDVPTGFMSSLFSFKEPVKETVTRQEFLKLLTRFQVIIDKALKGNKFLVFIGD